MILPDCQAKLSLSFHLIYIIFVQWYSEVLPSIGRVPSITSWNITLYPRFPFTHTLSLAITLSSASLVPSAGFSGAMRRFLLLCLPNFACFLFLVRKTDFLSKNYIIIKSFIMRNLVDPLNLENALLLVLWLLRNHLGLLVPLHEPVPSVSFADISPHCGESPYDRFFLKKAAQKTSIDLAF